MSELANDLPSVPGKGATRCDYCGKESDAEAGVCGSCGTPLPQLKAGELAAGQGASTSVLRAGQLNARSATLILLIYLGVQFGSTLFISLLKLNYRPNGGPPPTAEEWAALVYRIMPITLPVAMIAGGAALLFTSRAWVPNALKDRSPVGGAWSLGSGRQLLTGGGLGVLTGIGSLAIMGFSSRWYSHFSPGPLAKMGATPGLSQVALLAVAVPLAPVFEELLFRGILYGGYRCSFGGTAAAILTTAIFCLLHLTETIHFLPATLGIFSFAVVALWLRLKSAAIGPAVIAHMTYNGLVCLSLVLTTHVKA